MLLQPISYSEPADHVCGVIQACVMPGSYAGEKVARYAIAKLISLCALVRPLADILLLPTRLVYALVGHPTWQNIKIHALATSLLSTLVFTALSFHLYPLTSFIALGVHSAAMSFFVTGLNMGGTLGIPNLKSVLQSYLIGDDARVSYPNLSLDNLEEGSKFSSKMAAMAQIITLSAMLYHKKDLIVASTCSQLFACCTKVVAMSNYYRYKNSINKVAVEAIDPEAV